ncbi:MAG: sulfatase [Pseudomonadota bacterium]
MRHPEKAAIPPFHRPRSPTAGPAVIALGSALATGCHRMGSDSGPEVVERGWGRAHTVVIITLDALNADMLHGGPEHWDTAPRMMALLDESTVYRRGQSPRSITAPALASMLTGSYPAHHCLRGNVGQAESWKGLARTTLLERFQAAGYRTLGYSANQCYLLDAGTDQRTCTWDGELEGDYSLRRRDELLVEQLDVALRELARDDDIFLWLHLDNPHMPYEGNPAYYRQFHPTTYEGTLQPHSDASLTAVTLGERDYDEEDRLHLLATYASQIRESDDRVGRVLDALVDIGRYDDAVIVLGADHGEEIGYHHRYFWHGCSFYRSGIEVTWAFHAPGRLPAGWYETPISTVDIAPTLVDLADGFEWNGPMDGRSLVDQALAERAADEPVYVERGSATAGVVWQGYRYMLSGEAGYHNCEPYTDTDESAYPNQQVELYDLEADDDESHNLAGTGRAEEDDLEEMTCRWMLGSGWLTGFDHPDASLLDHCRERFGVE